VLDTSEESGISHLLCRLRGVALLAYRETMRAVALILLMACQPRPAPVPEEADPDPPASVRGLEAVRARGVLRVIMRTNGNSYFVWRGQRMGFHYEMATRLADELGVKLEIVVPERWSEMIPTLLAGDGDLIAASMTVTPERAARVRFATPYTLTHVRAVWRQGAEAALAGPEDLAGRTLHVRGSSSYAPRLRQISEVLVAAGRPAIEVVAEPEHRETEHILADVAAGTIPYSACDHHIAQVNKSYLPALVIGPALSDPQPLAWAVHPEATDLAAAIDATFARARAAGIYDLFVRRYYETPRTHAQRKRDRLYADASGRISPFDQTIQRAAEKYGFDWRLLVAQAFQESRFDPNAESWAGARGLFQIMPATAEELGVTDPTDPGQSIWGGARYLARMRDLLADVDDPEERLKMALASYNCGLGHVKDARKLAVKRGTPDDNWESVAAALTLLTREEVAAQATYGYVRAAEPIQYVGRIWDLFRTYRHATGERDSPATGDSSSRLSSPGPASPGASDRTPAAR